METANVFEKSKANNILMTSEDQAIKSSRAFVRTSSHVRKDKNRISYSLICLEFCSFFQYLTAVLVC